MPEILDPVTPVTPVVTEPVTPPAPVDEKPGLSLEQALEELANVRKEAAKHRTEKQSTKATLEALEAKVKEFEDAQLTETERMQKEFQEAKDSADKNGARAKALEVDMQLTMAAFDPTNEIGDLKAALKLIDRDTLEFDANGKVTNLQDALETLKTEYPSVKAGSTKPLVPGTTPTNPPKTPQGGKQFTRDDLKKMSPEQRVKHLEAGDFKHLL